MWSSSQATNKVSEVRVHFFIGSRIFLIVTTLGPAMGLADGFFSGIKKEVI
jgi:hypothetical protein